MCVHASRAHAKVAHMPSFNQVLLTFKECLENTIFVMGRLSNLAHKKNYIQHSGSSTPSLYLPALAVDYNNTRGTQSAASLLSYQCSIVVHANAPALVLVQRPLRYCASVLCEHMYM